MKTSNRKIILALLLVLILLPMAAYWLADAWLESSGGRRMIEKELSRRAGMPVQLSGDFDLMLYPAIGVSGTGLVIGGTGTQANFARSREYEISVALKPLLEKKVLVEWVRMTGGEVHPDRYPDRKGPAAVASATGVTLPDINELTIREFAISLPGDNVQPLEVSRLTIRNFADNRDTPFSLEIDKLASVEGHLRWESSRSVVHLGDLLFDFDGQSVSGEGCLKTRDPVSVHATLWAKTFDLDAFLSGLPDIGGGSDLEKVDQGGLPFEIRVRFSAGEVLSSGILAKGVDFSLGDEPACDSG